MHSRSDIRDRGTVSGDEDHDGDKGMLFYIEWPGIQGHRVAERGNAIVWKYPLHELAEWERYELNKEDRDKDIGNYRDIKYSQVGRDTETTYIATK